MKRFYYERTFPAHYQIYDRHFSSDDQIAVCKDLYSTERIVNALNYTFEMKGKVLGLVEKGV